MPLANGLLVDEELPQPVKARRRGIRLEDDLVVAAHRGVTDLEHGCHFGVGCLRESGACESHEPPGCVAVGMNLLRTGGHMTVTGSAKPLHGRERQINHGTMKHRAIHHGPAAGLIARKPLLAVRTPRARALVKIEVDLGTDFLEPDSRNDIPLEGHQGLDVSDLHTRSTPFQRGDVTSKTVENRHALTTKRQKTSGFLFWLCILLLFFTFFDPLYYLISLSIKDEVNSYIVLIPFISLYLAGMRRASIPQMSHVSRLRTTSVVSIAMVLLARSMVTLPTDWKTNDRLAGLIILYLMLNLAVCVVFQGYSRVRHFTFPFAFLFFMAPLPETFLSSIEDFLMRESTHVALFFLRCTNTPVLRNGQILELPGTALEVARECSGIRSTLMLFMTSIIASYLFLSSMLHRILFVAIIIPLGIIRNSIRILVIGLLCVYDGPHMIDSWIHHKGGGFFFGLSLIPLFLMVVLLRFRENKARACIESPMALPHPE
jgi:exosortase C (VPDSG-CTERM-specific)